MLLPRFIHWIFPFMWFPFGKVAKASFGFHSSSLVIQRACNLSLFYIGSGTAKRVTHTHTHYSSLGRLELEYYNRAGRIGHLEVNAAATERTYTLRLFSLLIKLLRLLEFWTLCTVSANCAQIRFPSTTDANSVYINSDRHSLIYTTMEKAFNYTFTFSLSFYY